MPVSNQRILDAIEQFAAMARDAVPGIYPNLQILIGELRRRDRGDLLAAHYAEGYRLLAASIPAIRESCLREALNDRLRALPAQMDTTLEWPRCQQQMERLAMLAADFAAAHPYPAAESPAFDAGVAALLKWEAVEGAVPASQMERAVPTRDRINAESLQRILRAAPGGWRDARIGNLKLLAGGVSKSMVMFDLDTAAGTEPLVARIDSDVPIMDGVYRGMKVSHEYHLLRYAWRSGVAVAEPRIYVSADNELGREMFLSSRLPGATRMDLHLSQLEPISPALLADIAALYVKIHRLPLDPADADLARTQFAGDPPPTRREAYRRWIEGFRRDWRSRGEPRSAVIESTLRWLADNVPADDRPPTIAHGDCGLNNMLTEGDRVTGLVDWETAHYGAPAEDVACFLFLTQGMVDPAAFKDAYVRAGGETPEPFALAYHSVIARIKLIVARDAIRQLYETRALARPELAVAAFVFGERTIADLYEAVRHADAIRPR